MLRYISVVLFIILSLTDLVSADWCYDGPYSTYYCSAGQTCGSYYGDCRGLPTYAIIAIVSISIMVLSLCLRCCMQISASTARQVPARAGVVRNPGLVRVQGHSHGNNLATRQPTVVQVHSIQEDAPPSYATAMSSNTGPTKY